MGQTKIKQIKGLQAVLDSITGIDSITETFSTSIPSGLTGIVITLSSRETDNTKIYINGQLIHEDVYSWYKDGVLLESETLAAGSELFWDSTKAGFELEESDSIEIIYETIGSGNNSESTLGTRGVVTGNLIPDSDEAYDLGSPTNKFRDLYLSGNTLYMGGQPLSVVNGALTLNGNPVTGSNIKSKNIIEGYHIIHNTYGSSLSDFGLASLGKTKDTINSNYLNLNVGDEIFQNNPGDENVRSLAYLMDSINAFGMRSGLTALTGHTFISGTSSEYKVGSLRGLISPGGYYATELDPNNIPSIGNTCFVVVGIKKVGSWPDTELTIPTYATGLQYPVDTHGRLILLDRATLQDSIRNNIYYLYSDFQNSNIPNFDLTDFINIFIMSISDQGYSIAEGYVNAEYYT